jgi:hypothetical protein
MTSAVVDWPVSDLSYHRMKLIQLR